MLEKMNIINVVKNRYLSFSVIIIPKTEIRAKAKNEVDKDASFTKLENKKSIKISISEMADDIMILRFTRLLLYFELYFLNIHIFELSRQI
ncbi:hypothetical protein ADIAL_1165 [Alkalibacterium sp. AK22]|nr:hypothetical protein ADIAL_1165 [Alkalibacterium sp. AK22]